jgi:hypothetical protein
MGMIPGTLVPNHLLIVIVPLNGAAQESNLPSVGLRRRTGFEDQLGHRPQPLRGQRNPRLRVGSAGYERATYYEGKERQAMAVDRGRRGGVGGIGFGGVLVIIGIIVAIVWSLWLGIIIALIGLIAFGGFVRGRWY